MNWNYEHLEVSLRSLLAENDSLSSSEKAEIERFLEVGEYGVAFETLCAIIKEEGKTIPDNLRAGFKSLAEQMNIERSWWEALVAPDNSEKRDV